MTTPKPVRADAQRNRYKLVRSAPLRSAREIVEAGKFFSLRFDDLASLAGVGTGTLYRHFPMRKALAEGVFHDEISHALRTRP